MRKLTWIGHSCFRIEEDGYVVILDPYADGSVPGLSKVREEADLVLCSHEHGDHNARSVIKLREGKKNPWKITYIDTWHDDAKGRKRGPNRITILDDGTCRIAHLGDLGCPLTEEQEKDLKGVDILLVPVGGHFTIDGNEAADLVKKTAPAVAIPMHFRSPEFGFDVISTVDGFCRRFEKTAALEESSVDPGSLDAFRGGILVLRPHCPNHE